MNGFEAFAFSVLAALTLSWLTTTESPTESPFRI